MPFSFMPPVHSNQISNILDVGRRAGGGGMEWDQQSTAMGAEIQDLQERSCDEGWGWYCCWVY